MTETPKSTDRLRGPSDWRPRASRFRAGLSASIHPGGTAAEAESCLLANLSRSGALLTQAPALPPGASVGITLSSSAGDLAVTLSGQVARAERTPQGDAVGVEFAELSKDQSQSLETFLSRVIEGSGSGPLAALGEDAEPDEIRATLEEMPLAHRMTLATRASLAERKLLAHDRNPQVLTALARNPNIGIEEVIALVSRPTLMAPTLACLARDPRWRTHEDLRVRLASHNGVTLQVAEQIAATLSRPARDRLLRRPGLKAPLRQKLLRRS